MKKYHLDGQYEELLKRNNVNLTEVLKKANLPSGLFRAEKVMMTSDEYRRFMDVIGESLQTPQDLIRMATGEGIEIFSPPIFAAYCSQNGIECIRRLKQYKLLIGPMNYRLEINASSVTVSLISYDKGQLSATFVVGEFLFLVNLLRKATKEHISPIYVGIDNFTINTDLYSEYFGIDITNDSQPNIIFRISDLHIPFISNNDTMWTFFKPELNKRLYNMGTEESVCKQVKAILLEALPAGKYTVDDVAHELGISRRTLQRYLTEEHSTFQSILNETRKELAIYYFEHTTMETREIAFLLGYQEYNSFTRAFTVWTGMSVSEFRRQLSLN
ncbi:AraC family transcriptional regulator [Veillonella denticariosi]|uniref:AraC family transcriptional regulator n=1 Tax=Veillonella denticariosi TaxID=419208 RepID=UPI00249138AF|nr:AraC family transcriptional regulator [Veillonella denticariosi]